MEVKIQINGKRIRQLRTGLRMTQGSLAKASRYSLRYLSRIEKESPALPQAGAEAIAEALNVTVEEIMGLDIEWSQDIIEAIPFPVFAKNRDGIYVGCNRQFCEYLGRTRQQIVGKGVFEVAPARHAIVYKAKDDDLFQTKGGKGGKQVYKARVVADEMARDVVFYKATYPVGGTPNGLIGLIVDVTDLLKVASIDLGRLNERSHIDSIAIPSRKKQSKGTT